MPTKHEINEMLRKIRKMLWEDWDPIGINDCSEAMDEYDNYAPGIVALIERNANEKKFFDHLWSIETVTMGMQGRRESTTRFAKQLLAISLEYNSRKSK